jgi:hypothetical protein
MEELDDDDFPIPWPQTPVAEGAERKELSEALRVLAQIELDTVHAALDPQIEEQEKPLTEIEQDEVQATPHKHAELMRRQEDSCFRQFMRLANLLLKMQKQDAEKDTRNEGSSGDVDENTGEAKAEREAESPELEKMSTKGNGQTVRNAGSAVQTPGSEAAKPEAEVQCPASGAAQAQSGVAGLGFGVGNGQSGAVKQVGACDGMPEAVSSRNFSPGL